MYSYYIEISPDFSPLIADYLDRHKGEFFDDLIAKALKDFFEREEEISLIHNLF